jgi:hypothetical protein
MDQQHSSIRSLLTFLEEADQCTGLTVVFTVKFVIEAGNMANSPYIVNCLNIKDMLGPTSFSHLISYISARG